MLSALAFTPRLLHLEITWFYIMTCCKEKGVRLWLEMEGEGELLGGVGVVIQMPNITCCK